MDSINKQQPEQKRENLRNSEAVQKLKELEDKAKTCFFCTQVALGPSDATRPMSVQKVDEEGNLWFLSAIDSYKNKEIAVDSRVKLYFQGSAHSDFVFITGIAVITSDQNKIDELWDPLAKVWFTEGRNDPRISVIRVAPEKGYYWDNKHGKAIAFVKMLIGAATGKTLDDSVEGTLKI